MEKKYIKPEIQLVELELQPMMAASNSLDVLPDETNTKNLAKEHTYSFDVWELDEE